MASNFTENYGLCQWEATDQVLREEFNQDNIKIEQAILAASTSPSCVTGSYVGNGETITVELGFQPSFLVIIPTGYQTSYNTDIVGAFGFSGAMTRVNRNSSCGLSTICTFTATGFTVSGSSLNVEGLVHLYAAFY